MIRRLLWAGALALGILAACSSSSPSTTSATASTVASSPSASGDVSIVGTWNCGPPDEPTNVVVEFRADGTATISNPEDEFAVTWSLEGDRGEFTFPVGPPEPFTVEADSIVMPDGSVCTPAG